MSLEFPAALHPIFVHFAIALTVASVGFDLLGRWRGAEEWHRVGRLNLLWGVAGIGLAAATGWLDHNRPHSHPAEFPEVHAIIAVHQVLGFSLLGGFGLLLAWRLRLGDQPPKAFLALAVTGALAILAQGYLGGELVFRYGTGVKSLANAHHGAVGDPPTPPSGISDGVDPAEHGVRPGSAEGHGPELHTDHIH